MGNENGEWVIHGLREDDPRRIKTPEELLAVIDREGFLPLFANGVPGFSVEERTAAVHWWSGWEEADPWEWRAVLARSGRVVYGKLFDKKAGFISLEWLPYFANARREGYDFDALWDDGKASYRAKRLMDCFDGGQRLFSYELRERAGFGRGGEKGFESVLTGLQMQLYLVTADLQQRRNRAGEPFGWSVGVLASPESLWGYDRVAAAYGEEPETSRRRVLERMEALYPAAPDRQRRRAAL